MDEVLAEAGDIAVGWARPMTAEERVKAFQEWWNFRGAPMLVDLRYVARSIALDNPPSEMSRKSPKAGSDTWCGIHGHVIMVGCPGCYEDDVGGGGGELGSASCD